MTRRPDPRDTEADALFAMGFFILLLPVLAAFYAISALVLGWASGLEAGVAFVIVLTQVIVVHRPRPVDSASVIAYGPVRILAKLIAKVSTLAGMGRIGEGLAITMVLWYPALVVALVILVTP